MTNTLTAAAKRKINDAFEKGWRFGSYDRTAFMSSGLTTARAVATYFPEYGEVEVSAFLNGYEDGSLGDVFRLHHPMKSA